MKNKVLESLENCDGYISGQALSKNLGVSRTMVWKWINELKSEGYIIEGVNNKGYRLVSSPDIMSPDTVGKYLTTQVFARNMYCYDKTDSTNKRAKEMAELGGIHGSLFVADEQTAGKGRRGHTWKSDKGTTISMSYLLKPDIDISQVSRITLVSALAIARALGKVDGVKPQIKWPNDVLANNRKLVGILTEMSSEGEDISYVVVGIGINVYNREFPEDIADKATSVFLENGEGCSRSQLVARVSNEFEKLYNTFVETGDLSFMVDEYNSYLVNRNREVYVIEGGERTRYTAIGLGADGGLLVRDEHGEVHDIISGEVSVRGIYGYV